MSELDTVYYHGQFEYVEFGHDVPEGDFARFVVLFIKMILKTFELENEEFPSSKPGRKSYSLSWNDVISLLFLFKRFYWG